LQPKDYAQLLGSIIGKLGLKATETALKLFISIGLGVLTFIGTKMVPAAAKVAVNEYRAMADNLIATMKTLGIDLQQRDALAIVKELHENRNQIQSILEKLRRDAN
jgi:hypothetical protein